MCLVNLTPETKGRVKAWKMVRVLYGRILPLCHDLLEYRVGRWTAAPDSEGIQAFVTKRDAMAARRSWNLSEFWRERNLQVVPVLLENYRKGKIDGMDNVSNGKPAYSARRCKVLPTKKGEQ